MMWLFACAEPTAEETGRDSSTVGELTTTDPEERPVLVSPEEAEDLDAGDAFRAAFTAAVATFSVDGEEVEGFSYNGQVPGPTVRVTVGQAVTVDLQNALDEQTTIHWHGLEVPNAMDGAGVLDDAVGPGEAYTYTFTPDRAGTYWYHPHLDVGRQVDAGLYGLFVVENPAESAADRELALVFDAWGEHAASSPEEDDHTDLPDPRTLLWTVNGLVNPVFPAVGGERIRVRALNASNTSYLALVWPNMRLIATDQGLLGAPEFPEQVVLAPGDRAEFEWDVEESFDVTTLPWVAAGGGAYGDPRTLLSVEVDTPGAPEGVEWPEGETAPSPDPTWTDLTYVFQGGGEGDWLIDGEAWPDVTVRSAALDADTVIEVRNLSSTNHPFHLHGNRFEVLSIDGVPVPARRIEDTIDVGIRQRVRLLLHATNPGDWLLHCHLLGHEEGGMMTVLRVE